MLLTALAVGILLMGIQLWLLTIALDLYLAGGSTNIWTLVIISGLVFLGGVLVWRVLRRRSRSMQQLG